MKYFSKKGIYLCIGVSFVIPILVNFLMGISTPWTYGDNWHGFWGSYLGSIIGVFGVYMSTKIQLDEQKKLIEQESKTSYRVYLSVAELIAPPKLNNIIAADYCKIITKDYYEDIKNMTDVWISFYQISYTGNAEAIVDCSMEIEFKDDENRIRYEKIAIGFIAKDDEIYVPLCFENTINLDIRKVRMVYTTLHGEKMEFINDLLSNECTYKIIEEVSKEDMLLKYSIESVNYLYPKRVNRNTK